MVVIVQKLQCSFLSVFNFLKRCVIEDNENSLRANTIDDRSNVNNVTNIEDANSSFKCTSRNTINSLHTAISTPENISTSSRNR